MKITKKELQRLIENYLFEKADIPKKVKAKGYTYELPGDGVVKITATPKKSKANIIILPDDMTEYNGKPLTKTMKKNKGYYDGIKGDIIGADSNAEPYFSKKKEKSSGGQAQEKDPGNPKANNANEFVKKIDQGLTEFLSYLLYEINKKFKLSEKVIKDLTNGSSTFTSSNVSYKTADRNALKDPFSDAEKQPTPKEKEGYKNIIFNLSAMIRGGDLDNLNLENTIEPEIGKLLGSKPEALLMKMRTGLGRIDTVGDSLKLGDAGEVYKDLERYAKDFLFSSFFLPSTLK